MDVRRPLVLSSPLLLVLLLVAVQLARTQTNNNVQKQAENDKLSASKMPNPGWKCVQMLRASNTWKSMEWKSFSQTKLKQFQCTWVIEGGGGSRIALSIPRIYFKDASQNLHCGRDFLQIIDQGVNKGRFCKRNQVTDYISTSHRVRVNVQGEYQLPHMLRAKKIPFTLKYRTVNTQTSGFKQLNTVMSGVFSRDVAPERSPSSTNTNNNSYDDNSKENNGVSWLWKMIIVLIFLLLLFLLLLVFYRRCYAKKKKRPDPEKYAEKADEDFYSNHKNALPVVAYNE